MLAAIILPVLFAGFSARGEEPPLPPVRTVLERMLERVEQEEVDAHTFKHRYSYTRTRVKEFRNGDNQLKKRETKTRVNNPAITAVNQPEPAEPDESSDTGDKPRTVSDTHTNVKGKAFEKSDFPLNEDLLKRFDFSVSGREVVNGRRALIVEFKPARKKPPEKGIKDRFINKAAGRAWVDEIEYALVKAEIHLTEQVNVVGGLVGAVSKFTLSMERDRTPEGLWYTRKQNWHLEGREVFLRRKVDFYEEHKDVRKVLETETAQLR